MFAVSPQEFADLHKQAQGTAFNRRYAALVEKTNEIFKSVAAELRTGREIDNIEVEVEMQGFDEDYAKELGKRLVDDLVTRGYPGALLRHQPSTEDRPCYSSAARVWVQVQVA